MVHWLHQHAQRFSFSVAQLVLCVVPLLTQVKVVLSCSCRKSGDASVLFYGFVQL
jgi:hypothetical protein